MVRARVPMAIRWKAREPGRRRVTDFVSTTNLAPNVPWKR